jgi:hypothetical protein
MSSDRGYPVNALALSIRFRHSPFSKGTDDIYLLVQEPDY